MSGIRLNVLPYTFLNAAKWHQVTVYPCEQRITQVPRIRKANNLLTNTRYLTNKYSLDENHQGGGVVHYTFPIRYVRLWYWPYQVVPTPKNGVTESLNVSKASVDPKAACSDHMHYNSCASTVGHCSFWTEDPLLQLVQPEVSQSLFESCSSNPTATKWPLW